MQKLKKCSNNVWLFKTDLPKYSDHSHFYENYQPYSANLLFVIFVERFLANKASAVDSEQC